MIRPVDGRYFSRANAYYSRKTGSDSVTPKMNELENQGFVALCAVKPERVAKLLALPSSKEEIETAVEG